MVVNVYDFMVIVQTYHLACPPQVPHQNASWLSQESALRLVGGGHVM